MSPARFLTFAFLAASFACILTLTLHPGDSRLIAGAGGTPNGLAAVRLSGAETSNAIVLAGFSFLVCSSRTDCLR